MSISTPNDSKVKATDLIVGVIQYHVQSGHIQENLNQVKQILEANSKFQKQKLDLLLLPEMGLTGFQYSRLNELASNSEAILSQLVKITAPFSETVAVTIPVSIQNKRILNRLTVNSETNQLAYYDKIHCIGYGGFRETDFFTAGQLPVAFNFKGWRIGLSVCYDLRFPELYRQLKAELYLVPSQWPNVRLNHLLILSKARAIENQAYLAFSNPFGKNGHLEFNGNSQIIDYYGETISTFIEKSGITVATLNYSKIMKWRDEFPVLKDTTLHFTNV